MKVIYLSPGKIKHVDKIKANNNDRMQSRKSLGYSERHVGSGNLVLLIIQFSPARKMRKLTLCWPSRYEDLISQCTKW